MAKIYNSITELIGNTPIINLTTLFLKMLLMFTSKLNHLTQAHLLKTVLLFV